MYKNPVPVAVCLVPIYGKSIDMKLMGVRRGIEPRKGFIALPGGYVNSGETWQEACCRELLEETGIVCRISDIKLFSVESALDSNRILIFGLASAIDITKINFEFKNEETQEIALIEKNLELAFPLHTLVAKKFFDQIFENKT